jgi:hypothetical protein
LQIIDDVGLPPPVLAALDRSESEEIPEQYDFRATALLEAPQILQLKRLHRNEIKAEASTMLWAIFGKGIHMVFELAGSPDGEWLREARIYQELDGVIVTGQMDLRKLENDLLQIIDYKFTSAYGLADKIQKWTQQLNVYAWLLRRETKQEVGSVAVLGLFRDWNKLQASRNKDYPQKAFMLIELPIWPQEQTEAFLRERIRLHIEGWAMAELGLFQNCTDTERWVEKRWIIRKPGAQKIFRSAQSQQEAEEWVKGQKSSGQFQIIPTRSAPRRCVGNWCRVAEWCPQWKREQEFKEKQKENGDNARKIFELDDDD